MDCLPEDNNYTTCIKAEFPDGAHDILLLSASEEDEEYILTGQLKDNQDVEVSVILPFDEKQDIIVSVKFTSEKFINSNVCHTLLVFRICSILLMMNFEGYDAQRT